LAGNCFQKPADAQGHARSMISHWAGKMQA
jgi:hypothetical protein